MSDGDDLVFKALADPTRRVLLDKLFEQDGLTLSELEAAAPALTRFGVMKHLAVLEQAGLVVTRKQGRHKHHYLNAVPIRLLLERWIDKYRDRHVTALLNLKDHLEGTKMTGIESETATATQVYQLYIRASQEEVWAAITRPEIVAKFFHGARVESTYEVGSKLRSVSPDGNDVWGDNTILECDPPRRLVHTWRSLYDPEMAVEPESRVTWEIESHEQQLCRLTLIHDRLDQSPKTAANVKGWSYILSNLKTVVETGKSLPPVE
ncbi:MAG: ArsR family transcriptional regulator [Mycolicibacterium sp.]|uniref:ArsR/SmtB family transcription factor n=1 Tax=Mycolicibacterium sp. TaxID=2320850 RepID=UPI000F94B378|nr:SRPBCC domain-containing protein [Mycolicibacterium sp.]RUP27002.1 MAG: ArsR family transcriptional regulator [Mycolicibacterium sp.]